MTDRSTCLVIAWVTLLAGAGQGPPARGAGAVDFARDVQPLLQSRCGSCHGADKQRGGLRLDRRAALLAGGDSGPALVPGQAAASLLLKRVGAANPAERMPPRGDPLAPRDIDLLRAWIAAGAAGNASEMPASDAGDHWAFRPLTRPAIPPSDPGIWPVQNPIDSFILARLSQEGLAPSPEADRATLIRRLKFDLLGLPPTPEEVAAFVADPHPDAYPRLVDRYLASPHFGERWARHWLDVVRFAESNGFEMNQSRPGAWPYRDYVIRAFNDDLPYNRFVTEQLAGDATGTDAATGFLVGGPWDQVKSPDPGLTAQQRADELHDIVSTTGSTFLGLTVGCARCHNHKFDPVTQTDYYRLTATFAGVQHGERAIKSDDAVRRREADLVRRQLQDLVARAEIREPLAQPDGPPGRRPAVNPRRNVERFAPVAVRRVRFTVLATNSAEPCLDELEVFTAGPSPVNAALASAGARPSSSGNFPGGGDLHRLEHINDGRHGNGRSWISHEPGRGWVQLDFPQTVTIDRIAWARDREGRYQDRLPIRYRIEVAADEGPWSVVASSDDRVPFGASPSPGSPPGAEDQRAALERRLTELERPAQVYAGQFTTPPTTHRLHRGEPLQKREPVPPGAPARLGPTLLLPADAPEQERRLALARWLVDPANPLIARVAANRLWHYHFGKGLVGTPSDLGVNGERPSHPELLDWLAAELVANRWSLKSLHRLIVLSAAYRQDSRPSPRGLAADAGDRWLWRFPPRRLEAEPLRDAMLAVTGSLNTRMGGPGFDLFEPNTNYVKVYTPRKTFGPEEWRRMVYQTKPRMQLEDTFGAFDCPDAGQIAPRRTSSTTALQALNLLNSRFTLQQADRFAQRLLREAGPDPTAQVRRAFALAFQRQPSDEETAAGAALVREHGLEALTRALLNANEFLYVY